MINPLISIMIPTWNRDESVLDIVKVVNKSLIQDIEIVIVDNNSDEKFFRFIESNIKSFPNVRLYRNNENIGMTPNWNKCIQYSKGEWLGLICSDDIYKQSAIPRVREIIKTLGEPGLIIQSPHLKVDIDYLPKGYQTVNNIELPIASGQFWHRSISEQLGGFNETIKYSPDAEYWFRIAYSYPVVRVQEAFAEYREHNDNYMWETLRKDDYIQQNILLSRILLNYKTTPELAMNDEYIDQCLDQSLKGTIYSILNSSFLKKGKSDIFFKYLKFLNEISKSPIQKISIFIVLASIINGTIMRLLGKFKKLILR
ncbi:MAG: hypothetical protein CVV49_02540 [Spirochaetae bacterium HGW-Spirochaetae-5]|nr:MAG: hypothetical protein CVV49_02540 [Spirochaetae bacterium HGW-Spirochaetae-5]